MGGTYGVLCSDKAGAEEGGEEEGFGIHFFAVRTRVVDGLVFIV